MSEGTRRPPSYYRYREGHPTVSVVLSKYLKDAIDATKPAGVSYGQFIKELLTKAGESSAQAEEKMKAARERGYAEGHAAGQKVGYEKGRSEGYSKGHEEGKASGFRTGKSMYMISVPCVVCGEPITLFAHPDDVRYVTKCLQKFGWGHTECRQRLGWR